MALAAELRIPVAPVSDGPAVAELRAGACARGSLVDDPTGTFRVPAPSVDDRRRGVARRRARARAWASTPARSCPARRSRRRPRAAELPLHGVKVLDLTAWWAGPSASAMLAALGADVVHVESVTRADGMRFTSGVSVDRDDWWEYSALFHASNTNKRDLTLDLAAARGPRRSRCA